MLELMYLYRPHGTLSGLAFVSATPARLSEFNRQVLSTVSDELNVFHQGDTSTWQMFEFWCNSDKLVEATALSIAKNMGIELLYTHPNIRQLVAAIGEDCVSRSLTVSQLALFLEYATRCPNMGAALDAVAARAQII